jgi:hypothetical protein
MKSILLALIVLSLAGAAVFWIQKSGFRVEIQGEHTSSKKFEAAMLHWMSLNVPDKEAELLIVTEPPVLFKGLFHRLVKIRARNGFGAFVINDLLVLGTRNDDVQKVQTGKEFASTVLEMEGSDRDGYQNVVEELDKIMKRMTKP